LRWGALAGAAAIAVTALVVGGVLGSWQWDRAHQQSRAIDPDPIAPLADIMRPGESGRGEGRLVEVTGEWSEAPAALIAGKEIDGVPAVLLIVPLTVPSDLTGTGSEGTLGVMAGWLPAQDVADAPLTGADASFTGYVRAGEGASPDPDESPVEGAVWLGSISTASLAQHWPAPVYSYLVVSDEPAPGWRQLPAPVERTQLDLKSLTYSAEWWLFGLFAAALAVRWMRDNGREPLESETTAEEDA
jgi:cytochrome oxidase assembly protein ShyY1